MPKLARKSAKLFAENATAQAGGIAQFGSLAAGTPNYSKDPDVIQGLSQYADGWSAAVLGTKSPALEDRNALDYLLSYQQAYIMQHGVPEWISTETYYEHSYVVDSNGELRVSVIDNNTGHDPAEDNGGSYWGYAGARGSGKQIGEVYFSQSSDGNDNKGALPLFTGEVIVNANNIYPQFYAWVLAHTSLCKTEAEWQTAVTTYGECPFYVIDDTNKTIRLPKLGNYIKMANITDGITQSEDSIPLSDHYHVFGFNTGDNSGKFSASNNTVTAKLPDITQQSGTRNWNGSGGGGGYVGNADTLTGNMITTSGIEAAAKNADAKTPVTPAHTTVFPWVFAFNAAIPASTAQAAQFQAALSGKVDTADLTEVQCVVETYRNGSSWYRVWSDGWCEQGGRISTQSTVPYTVNLLKEYADTNYSVFTQSCQTSTNDNYNNGALVRNITVSSFDVLTNESDGYRFWEAKGYIN